MKIIKRISSLLPMFTLMASFCQCSSAQKLQKEAPTGFGEVYCQSWTAGVQGGGSGINIFIPVTDNSMVLDSVYFRNKVAKLESKIANQTIYIGRFKTDFNQPKDIILSSDSKQEYTNRLSIVEETIPFKLNDDQCVVSYKKGDKTMYYKISNVIQKQSLNYPSAPPRDTIKLN